MLEILNTVRKCAHIFSFRKYNFQYQDTLNFADVCGFYAKSHDFLLKIVLLLKTIA